MSAPPPPDGRDVVETEPTAVVAVVLAGLTWVACPVILAVVALVVARTAEDRIRASGGALGGMGLVTTARVLAWVHLALVLLGAIVVALLVAALPAFG